MYLTAGAFRHSIAMTRKSGLPLTCQVLMGIVLETLSRQCVDVLPSWEQCLTVTSVKLLQIGKSAFPAIVA